jgi:hypothetical protein
VREYRLDRRELCPELGVESSAQHLEIEHGERPDPFGAAEGHDQLVDRRERGRMRTML